ncbi:MAG: hypothetical protein GPJ54_06560 [Candidatus Heimdallarchaeota archaeon]|nr:hypothetical protein [Candidatus Heimdallarchaeota archaeon]
MTREALIDRLKGSEASAVDLAKEFNRSVSGIEEDIEHIRTTLRLNDELDLMIRPAVCALCDYVFPTNKAKTPNRCPNCKKEKIQVAKFKVRINNG